MLVKDVDVMIDMHDEIRHCEVCDRTDGPFECHHIWSRGMGGGGRLDIRWNLIILCRDCHALAHKHTLSKRTLWGIASEREIYALLRK
jgi:5-methylcytosine-specific restriction endonuclease McrA